MTPPPALSDDTLPDDTFFAQRVALSALALEIDEILRRSGGDTFAPRPSFPSDAASRPAGFFQTQTTHAS